MPFVSATVDSKQIADLMKGLGNAATRGPAIISQTLNREGRRVAGKIIRSIVKNLNISKIDVGGEKDEATGKLVFHRYGGVRHWPASRTNLVTTVSVTGKRIPLYRFSLYTKPGIRVPIRRRGKPQVFIKGGQKIFRYMRSIKTRQGGVVYRILRRDGAKTIDQAFTAKMQSGHNGVFRRNPQAQAMTTKKEAMVVASPSRRKIFELFGPSLPVVAETVTDLNIEVKFSMERIEKELQRRMKVEVLKLAEKTAGGA